MKPPSIRRRLVVWVLGALSLGTPLLVLAAYLLTLQEMDEMFDDGLRQTALLIADRGVGGALPAEPVAGPSLSADDTESKLVALARARDGRLLFSSQPELTLAFAPTAGASLQRANGEDWHVFTVVQDDRTVQVAQPTSVRSEGAAETASQLVLPLFAVLAAIGAMVLFALRRGLAPLSATSDALALRSADSLAPLDLQQVPLELLPLVRTMNDLLHRLAKAFAAQRNFVADAAHELRSPVTALQLQAEVLERSRDPVERTEAAAELAAGIARARRLIEQLLYLSRATADDSSGVPFAREPLRLGDLARAAVVRWSREAQRRLIDLGVDAGNGADTEASNGLTVHGDPHQLEILLNNLVENALRYTPAGGIVDVVAGTLEGAPTLRVIDNGPGIPAAERGRVFDRFYRSPDAVASGETGSGLGLAIVKLIADRHGATVSLHDGRAAAGLEVRVVFPVPA